MGMTLLPRLATLALPLCLVLPILAWAQADPAMAVQVQNAWARASAGQSATAVAYLTLRSHAGTDRLLSASTPSAAKAELHETSQAGGVARMRPVADLPLPPGQPVTLAPGGLHIMLTGLAQPLRAGESFSLTLHFAQAPPVTVQVPVRPAGAPAPSGPAPSGPAPSGPATNDHRH